jgi:hypothetical protein
VYTGLVGPDRGSRAPFGHVLNSASGWDHQARAMTRGAEEL